MPLGCNFRGTGGRWCVSEKKDDFSVDLNVPSELLLVTVFGRQFQVAGAEQRNARLANAVLANGSDS